MNKTLYHKLVSEAGFELWQGEAWQPEGQLVDWSCDYDQELAQLVELVVRECARRANVSNLTGDYYTGRRDSSDLILQHWQLAK